MFYRKRNASDHTPFSVLSTMVPTHCFGSTGWSMHYGTTGGVLESFQHDICVLWVLLRGFDTSNDSNAKSI
jgi:hypothetical protein